MSRTIPGKPSSRRITLAAVLLTATLSIGATIHLGATPGAHPQPVGSTGSGAVQLSGVVDRTAIRLGEREVVNLELRLDARDDGDLTRTAVPTDLVVVLDRSGSMAGDKIVHARAAIRALASLLGPADRFALVSYAQGARLDVPLASAEGARTGWLARVDAIVPQGGTNLAAGLDRGLALIEGSRDRGHAARLILISDGLANQGDTSHAGLRTRAQRAVQGEYTVSTVGVGLEFDEQLLGSIARAGTGNYHYVESAVGLEPVFAGEFLAARTTAASALWVEITPGAGVHVDSAESYPLERLADGRVRFRPGALYGGQQRSIWVSLGIDPSGPTTTDLGEFAIRYREGVDGTEQMARLDPTPQVERVASEEDYLAGFDADVWARSVTDGALGRLRRSVASAVRDGRPEEAKRELEAYRSANAPLAEALVAPAVVEEIRALDSLEADVDDAFVGKDQKAKQSRVSKQLHALGYVE